MYLGTRGTHMYSIEAIINCPHPLNSIPFIFRSGLIRNIITPIACTNLNIIVFREKNFSPANIKIPIITIPLIVIIQNGRAKSFKYSKPSTKIAMVIKDKHITNDTIEILDTTLHIFSIKLIKNRPVFFILKSSFFL